MAASREFKKRVGQAIYEGRTRMRLSQDAFAVLLEEELGHAPRADVIGNWENGTNLPRVETLAAIAEILEVTVDELISAPGEGLVSRIVRLVVDEIESRKRQSSGSEAQP